MSVEYSIRPAFKSEFGDYVIAKFDGSPQPVAVYRIYRSHGRQACTCPGYVYRRRCKHIDMINQELLVKSWEPTKEDFDRVARELDRILT